MPSNHTTNYSLNQWVKDDRVLMEDFNADNAKIDAAIKGVEERLTQAVASAAAKAEKEHVYVGSYTGDGSNSRTIYLPWAPKFMVMCTTAYDNPSLMLLVPDYCMFLTHETVSYGSSIGPVLSGSTLTIRVSHWCNTKNETMYYILFR